MPLPVKAFRGPLQRDTREADRPETPERMLGAEAAIPPLTPTTGFPICSGLTTMSGATAQETTDAQRRQGFAGQQ
jgi:hypothetical protein